MPNLLLHYYSGRSVIFCCLGILTPTRMNILIIQTIFDNCLWRFLYVLLRILNLTSGERPYTCEKDGCSKAYATQHSLKQHKSKDHKDDDRMETSAQSSCYDLVSRAIKPTTVAR